MPEKVDKMSLPKSLDRRIKLTDAERKLIRELYAAGGISQRKLAVRFNVSRRLITFILNPDQYAENLKRRKERGGSKQYYDKDYHRVMIKSTRNYKKRVLLGRTDTPAST